MFTTENIKKMVADNRLDLFYNSRAWRNLSSEVRREQNNECQYCKAKGKVKPAEFVHHVKHIRQFPALAYSKYFTDENGKKQRQLVCCCYWCHEEKHGRTFISSGVVRERYTNAEKW